MSKYIDELTELICDTVRTVFPNASLDDGYDVADEVIAKLPTIEVSEDCISREWVQNKLTEYVKDYALNELDSWQNTIVEWIATDIEDAPSVVPTVRKNRQVKRAEGEWKFKKTFPNDDSEFPMGYLVCSVCGSQHANATPCNYCPNCGAKMKG